MKKRYVMGMVAVAAATWITTAQAADTLFVGARAMGMAGANVASADNNAAQYYNPAVFGFFSNRDGEGKRTSSDINDLGRKDFGFDVYAGVGYSIRNDMGKFLDELSQIDINQLKTGVKTESDLVDLVNLVADLNGLDQPGNAIAIDVNGGTSVRVKHVGVGLRFNTDVLARVANVDRDNLGIQHSATGGDLNAQLTAQTPQGFDPAANYNFFTATQTADLLALGLTAENVKKIEFSALAQGVPAAASQAYFDTFKTLAGQSISGTGGTLDQNTTKVVLSGFGVVEVPVTYGYAVNDHVSVGGNLKLLRGRVYGNEALVFDTGSGDVLKKTKENFEETTTFGVDLGVMARYRHFNLGLTGRNLNSPKFDGFTKNGVVAKDATLKPQLTAGVAYIPFTTLAIEADYDLLKYASPLKDIDTQNLALGVEWDVMRTLALRAGVTKNLAESDLDWIYTGGLGFNFWLVRLDLAAAVSPEKVQFKDKKAPKLAKVAVQVSVDF
jgi:hypothetical protein